MDRSPAVDQLAEHRWIRTRPPSATSRTPWNRCTVRSRTSRTRTPHRRRSALGAPVGVEQLHERGAGHAERRHARRGEPAVQAAQTQFQQVWSATRAAHLRDDNSGDLTAGSAVSRSVTPRCCASSCFSPGRSLLRVLWYWCDRFDSPADQPFVPLGDDDEADGCRECDDRDCLTDRQARGGAARRPRRA